MRFAVLIVAWVMLASCGEDAATRMCLGDNADLKELIAKSDNTANRKAILVYQVCRLSCESAGNQEACQAFKDVTAHLCKAEGPATCKKLCGDPDGKRNETACALVQ